MVGGDFFNNVIHLNERLGFTITLPEVVEFKRCIRECGLNEHTTSGPFYTWSNKKKKGRVGCFLE